MLKIAHISLHIDFHPGIAKTRMDEAKAGKELKDCLWDVFIVSPDTRYKLGHINFIKMKIPSFLYNKTENNSSFMFFLVRAFSLNFLIYRIKFNLIINKIAKQYDTAIVRYNSGDLIGWLFLKKGKIILYPHNKPYEELLLYSKLGAFVEKITSKYQYIGIRNICAESTEILEHEILRNKLKFKGFVFPNGTYVNEIKKNEFSRREKKINIIMVSSEYQLWQGLDLLLDAFLKYEEDYVLHIVGNAKNEYQQIMKTNENIKYYGILPHCELKQLYNKCDIGIGSLAVFRKNIKKLNSLKVRDYLANGLGVYLTYDDPAFPSDFKFLKYETSVTAENIIKFSREIRNYEKSCIIEKSKLYIDYRYIIKDVIQELTNNKK